MMIYKEIKMLLNPLIQNDFSAEDIMRHKPVIFMNDEKHIFEKRIMGSKIQHIYINY